MLPCYYSVKAIDSGAFAFDECIVCCAVFDQTNTLCLLTIMTLLYAHADHSSAPSNYFQFPRVYSEINRITQSLLELNALRDSPPAITFLFVCVLSNVSNVYKRTPVIPPGPGV